MALFAGRNVSTLLLRMFHVLLLAEVRSCGIPFLQLKSCRILCRGLASSVFNLLRSSWLVISKALRRGFWIRNGNRGELKILGKYIL